MKKAQIKLAETIGILVIFFLLMVFGFGFYGGVQGNNVKKAETKAFELRTIEVAQRVLFLSELQCTEDEAVDIDCFDLLKVKEFYDIAAKEPTQAVPNTKFMASAKLHYLNIFGKSKITLHFVYPKSVDYPEPDGIILYKNFDTKFTRKLVTNVPVSIYKPTKREYAFGYIQIEVAQ